MILEKHEGDGLQCGQPNNQPLEENFTDFQSDFYGSSLGSMDSINLSPVFPKLKYLCASERVLQMTGRMENFSLLLSQVYILYLFDPKDNHRPWDW